MRSFRVSESLKSGGKEAGRKGSVRPGKAELTSFEPEPDYFLIKPRALRGCEHACGIKMVVRPLFTLIQLDAGQAAFVVEGHGRPVLDGAVDVVDIDVLAEDGGGAHIVVLDRRAGEADE